MRTGARGSALRDVVRGQWRLVSTGSVLYAFHQGFEALVPVLIGVAIDQAVSPGSGVALIRWIGVLGLVFLGLTLSFRYGAQLSERASYQAAHGLRLRLTERVLDQRAGAEQGRLAGQLVNIATNDAKRAGAVNLALPIGIAAMVGSTVAGVALLRSSILLGLVVLLGTPVLLGLAHLLGKPLEKRSDAEQARAASASGTAADLVAGLRVLKGIRAVPAAVAQYRTTSRKSLAATLRAARAEAFHDGAMLLLSGLMIGVIALVGGRLAARGEISVGDLVAAVGLAQFLLGPLETFAWVNGQLAQGRASAHRIDAILNAPPAVTNGKNPPPDPTRGHIRLRALTHGELRDVDVNIPPGSLIGIVTTDPNAATTLVDCFARTSDPEHGSIELDGTALSTLDLEGLRAAIVVAAHETDLFELSLWKNITPHAEQHDSTRHPTIDEAMIAAGADEVARTLPEGAATVLTERGRSLSGGQRQRVALARALAAEPSVLIAHEPTTAVDAATETRIADGIRAMRTGRTTILLTTSPALLAITDSVVFLDGGIVAAEGRHTELLNHEPYKRVVLT